MTPIHVITGFLGAGKTTLLLNQLSQRAEGETCAVIVNDFGDARFDATLLEGKAWVRDIPGGCVCCTAPENLAPTVKALLSEAQPDRIFIEATGLARPADIVDTLRRSLPQGDVEVGPVVAVVDPQRWDAADAPALLREQLEASDIVVISRREGGDPAAEERLGEWAKARHPPLLGVFVATLGAAPTEIFDLRHGGLVAWRPSDAPSPSTKGWDTASAQWGPEWVFDMGKIREVLQTPVERIKGIFGTDIGWYRVERAGGAVDIAPTPYHSASRVDVIAYGSQAAADKIIERLQRAQWVPPPEGSVAEMRVQRADGSTERLDRAALMALSGQVDDVSAHVPGRKGRGVWLREVLKAAGAQGGQRFIITATDGMTTEPVQVSAAGDAIVVHSLGDGPYPPDKGGPFRVFVPPDAGRSACANVKKVARVVINAQ